MIQKIPFIRSCYFVRCVPENAQGTPAVLPAAVFGWFGPSIGTVVGQLLEWSWAGEGLSSKWWSNCTK
jgi:hypothetical protein